MVQSVVQQFRGKFEEASSEDDIRQASKTKETPLELDTKLEDFTETRIEVSDYQQVVKNKYEALELPKESQVAEIIEKFKSKHPDIIFV